MKAMSKKTLLEIIAWILDHKDDTKAMDNLSNIIFPHTSKYKDRYPKSDVRVQSSGDDI